MKRERKKIERRESSLHRGETDWNPPQKQSPFSLVPLLLFNRDISAATRHALSEDRLEDAVNLLMSDFGLTNLEARHLVAAPDPSLEATRADS